MQDNAFTNKVKQIWAFIKRVAKRVWEYLKVAKMEWIVMVGVFAFDLITKALVFGLLEANETFTLIPKFLNIHRISNYNAAFGSDTLVSWLTPMGARIFFSVFAVAASVAFVLVLIKNKGKSKWFRVAIALFVAGAMGNCIDRMFLGYVRDFIEFVYFGLTIWGRQTWYVFNIADAALVAGVIMIIVYFLFMYRDGDKKKVVLINEDGDNAAELGASDGSADGAAIEQNVDETDAEKDRPTQNISDDGDIAEPDDGGTVRGVEELDLPDDSGATSALSGDGGGDA